MEAEPEMAEPEMAEDTAEEPVSDTPTVKEIIRRVGDLARELEKAEAQRKASLGAEAPMALEDTAEAETPEEPPMDQAASA